MRKQGLFHSVRQSRFMCKMCVMKMQHGRRIYLAISMRILYIMSVGSRTRQRGGRFLCLCGASAGGKRNWTTGGRIE